MNKYTNPEICTLPKASELREQLSASMNSSVREQIASLFDEATFVETGAFTHPFAFEGKISIFISAPSQ